MTIHSTDNGDKGAICVFVTGRGKVQSIPSRSDMGTGALLSLALGSNIYRKGDPEPGTSRCGSGPKQGKPVTLSGFEFGRGCCVILLVLCLRCNRAKRLFLTLSPTSSSS